MRVTMVGSGYVGLVTGVCLADFGHTVTCVDVDPKKITALKNGRMPIYEPGLDKLVENSIVRERIFFTTDLAGAVKDAEVIFIAVGTPSRHGDGLPTCPTFIRRPDRSPHRSTATASSQRSRLSLSAPVTKLNGSCASCVQTPTSRWSPIPNF